jgi:hypothetical protein
MVHVCVSDHGLSQRCCCCCSSFQYESQDFVTPVRPATQVDDYSLAPTICLASLSGRCLGCPLPFANRALSRNDLWSLGHDPGSPWCSSASPLLTRLVRKMFWLSNAIARKLRERCLPASRPRRGYFPTRLVAWRIDHQSHLVSCQVPSIGTGRRKVQRSSCS